MPKQVKNETAVYHLAVTLQDYDSCNPDVGMPPGHDQMVMRAAQTLGLTSADYDHNHVLNLMRARRR